MPIKTLTDPKSTMEALKEMAEWSNEIRFAYAWITPGGHWDALSQANITRGIAGINFSRTDPSIIKPFIGKSNFQVAAGQLGVFHPKILIAIKSNEVYALIGSSNCTRSAFTTNIEFNLLINGPKSHSVIRKLMSYIDSLWNATYSWFPTEEWLIKYAKRHENRQDPIVEDDIVNIIPNPQKYYVRTVSQIDVDWSDYYQLIRSQRFRLNPWGENLSIFEENGSYLWEIRQAFDAFANYAKYETIPDDKRRIISGLKGSTGYFGDMCAAGYYSNIVIEHPHLIGRHLDKIPKSGPVSNRMIMEYLTRTMDLTGVALPTSSRLLAMKRPDLFIAVNRGNQNALLRVFGFYPRKPKGYIDLIKKIKSFAWSNSTKTRDRVEADFWMSRVSMIDTMLYEHPD